MEHIIIYREPGRYAGWPANYGIWHWNNEIVVGFTVGYHNANGGFHARDKSRPFRNIQARSLDGGLSWSLEDFAGKTPGQRGLSADEHMHFELGIGQALEQNDITMPVSEAIRFKHPDFALMCARTGLDERARSFFYVSYDRCKTWQGPFKFPMFGQTAIAARTDYLVENDHSCLFFLTANKANGTEGKVICVLTQDGGKSFTLVSEIGGEPKEPLDFKIMPSSLKLANGRLVTALRCRQKDEKGNNRNWIDLYTSDDTAQSWTYLKRPVQFEGHNGNPGALCQLADERLLLVYGNRDNRTMAARLSDDNGQTWQDEHCIRENRGGNHDIGYPRAVVLADGTVVVVYYFNDAAHGERFIEASRWTP